MPTGYTSPIYDGEPMTGHEFILRCARAFGAVGMEMRDMSLNVPVTSFVRSTQHEEQEVVRAQAQLDEVNAMSVVDAASRAQREFDDAIKRYGESVANAEVMRARYQVVVDQVEAWTPPTPEHEDVKKFALEQLQGDIDFYGRPHAYKPEAPQTGAEWLFDYRDRRQKALTSAQERLASLRQRNIEDAAWVQSLVGSLDLPVPVS